MLTRTHVALIVGLLGSSTCPAAMIRLISQAEIPANSPTVTFNALQNTSPTGQVQTYFEAGATFTGRISPWGSPAALGAGGGTWLLGMPGYSITYSQPVTEVGWQEYFGEILSVTLFADFQGTQSLGTYIIATGRPEYQTALRFHGFSSDVAFRRMAIASLHTSAGINDLRYAPEPAALLSVCAGAIAFAGRGVLVRRRR